MTKGFDGLTLESLRASRASWWDEAFTRRLLDQLPAGVETILDVGCGLARAAHALLPHVPSTKYIGVDADEDRVRAAASELATASYAARAELRVGRAEALPIASTSIDAVMAIMTLQHLDDVPAALVEATRVLKPGGTMIAVEPDNLGQRFYLDGPLDELNEAVAALVARARAARLPRDPAIGPRVPALMAAAGLQEVTAAVHAVHRTCIEPADAFLERVRTVVHIVADQANLDRRDAAACVRAIERAMTRERTLTCHVVPVFVCRGGSPRQSCS